MNIIGLCQGGNLRVFARIVEIIRRNNVRIDRLGVFVADAAYASRSPERVRLQSDSTTFWLEEWVSLQRGLARDPDDALLRRYELELGPPSLWAALLADRRLFFGRYCKSRQDYRPRYSERQMLGALTEAIEQVERLFAETGPNLIFGFAPVTMHEYVALRLAEARNIPILLLRSTKIENYVSLNDRVFGLSRHIEGRLANALDKPENVQIAGNYISRTRARGAVYEGMHQPAHAMRRFRPIVAARAVAASCKQELRRLCDPLVRRDPHNPGYLIPALSENFLQPWRSAQLRGFLARCDRAGKNLDESPFCLFPLHFEPEIALQLYARPLQNQIEVARTIALSLPVGMRLVVKEHPRSAGFRPMSYYRKLLEIPNVLLAAPETPSHLLVRAASLVCVITGNIGLEACALNKPVIVLGETDYANALPSSMLRVCHDLYSLSAEVVDLLNNFKCDEQALLRFLAATIDGSVPVDLYSALLGKAGRHALSQAGCQADMERLGDYVLSRISSSCLQ